MAHLGAAKAQTSLHIYVQSGQSIGYSYTQSVDINEGSDQSLDL